MSHAPVGQRSAQRPQWRHTSSSFTMTRPVFSVARRHRGPASRSTPAPSAGRAAPSSSALSVKVMQSTGQMSTQASHSMQSVS